MEVASYSLRATSSATGLRSPLTRVTWPNSDSPLSRSIMAATPESGST